MKLNDFLEDYFIYPDLKFGVRNKEEQKDKLNDLLETIFYLHGNDVQQIIKGFEKFYGDLDKIRHKNFHQKIRDAVSNTFLKKEDVDKFIDISEESSEAVRDWLFEEKEM